jgi:hypothetical protein
MWHIVFIADSVECMYIFCLVCLKLMYFVACNCLDQLIIFSVDTKDL